MDMHRATAPTLSNLPSPSATLLPLAAQPTEQTSAVMAQALAELRGDLNGPSEAAVAAEIAAMHARDRNLRRDLQRHAAPATLATATGGTALDTETTTPATLAIATGGAIPKTTATVNLDHQAATYLNR